MDEEIELWDDWKPEYDDEDELDDDEEEE